MEFSNALEFVDTFGAHMTSRQIQQQFGITRGGADRLAAKCGITPLDQPLHIPGLEHLPGLPDFATTRTWVGGTWFRIDCAKAGDSPGYRSLLIHLSRHRDDDAPEPEDTHAEQDS